MARRGRTRRRRSGRRRVGRRTGNRALNGGMLRGRMHPPTNTAAPWNNYVVTFLWTPVAPATGKDFVDKQSLKSSGIRTAVIAELGLAGSIDMRIRRIDVWVQPQLTNSQRNNVIFAPYDFVKCSATINWYEAWGTTAQPAHCHYLWPKSTSNVVISASDDCGVVLFDCRDERCAYIVKCHLLWRKDNPNPYTETGTVTGLRSVVQIPPPNLDDLELGSDISAVT